ncbi:MAG: hypothetical protein AAF558_11625, partial [Verrucomicrobiota bacterium]
MMMWYKVLLGMGAWIWAGSSVWAVAPITAVDVDGVTRTLNDRSKVMVMIYSNPAVQNRTRDAGASLDRFQGLKAFRSVVIVDLRGTLATL